MNSPNLMAAVGGAAHQEAEAADLRQPAAAARAAAPGRRAGDARLPVERPADLRLCPRHPARIPGAQHPALRIARPLRGSLRDHHPRLDRGGVLLRRAGSGRTSDVALWPRPVQQPHPPIWMPIVGSKESIEFAARAQHPDHAGSGASAGCATTSSAITRNAWREPATASRRTICRSAVSAYVADSKAQAVQGDAGPTCSISTARCSATATSPRPACSGRPATRPTPRPTMCARRTCAPRNMRARISAT